MKRIAITDGGGFGLGNYVANVNSSRELLVALSTLPDGTKMYPLDQTQVRKALDWTSDHTGTTIWDPTTDTRFYITDIIIALDATADGTVTLYDNTDSTANRVIKVHPVANGGIVVHFVQPYRSGAVNNILKYSTSGGCKGSIFVQGFEIA